MTRTQIGSSARRTRTVTARDVELFTEITGDRNPLHYDADLAARSRFGGLVVQGGVTSGLLNALVAEQLPGPGSVFLEVAWRFTAPVRPGDVITAHATVTSVREDKPVTGLVTTVTNQDGVVVLDGTAVVWRDPVVAAAADVLPEGSGRGRPEEAAEKAPFLASSSSTTRMPEPPAPAQEDQ
jgi:acyl dehydratase